MGYGHTVISSSPIDVNLAKQINILLENLGMPSSRMIIDPTTGGLGYGLEYSYSVMERLRMAAMAQGDDKLQLPIINNLGNEVWKCKEAKLSAADAPTLGDPEKRGILMEAVGAVTYLMAGSDILIMRHPEAIRMAKSFIDILIGGGKATDVAPIKKQLDDVELNLAALSPAPNLTIEEDKVKAVAPAAAKAAAPKVAEKPQAAPAKVEVKAAPQPEAKPAVAPVVDTAALEAKADAEASAKAAAGAKAKLEADAKAKADAEARVKAEAEAKAKSDADAAIAKREAEEDAIRQQRAKEREARMAEHQAATGDAIALTPAAVQKTAVEKILEQLNRIHRRV
jgi:acetyl-CoA decarbonylase/synthase complex subunit delta